jgi:hypothetical protein
VALRTQQLSRQPEDYFHGVCLRAFCTGEGFAKLTCFFVLAGMNEDAQCGTGDELKVLSPRQIDFDEDGSNYVVDVSCGHSHTGEYEVGINSFIYICCDLSSSEL